MTGKKQRSDSAVEAAAGMKVRVSSSKRDTKLKLSVYPLEKAREVLDKAINAASAGELERLVFRELSHDKFTFFWDGVTFNVDREAYEYALDKGISCGVLVTLFDELPYLEF